MSAPVRSGRSAWALCVLVALTVLGGFLLDLPITVVWPVAFAVTLLGALALALTRRSRP